MREVQLKNLNKALKDEVRKFTRNPGSVPSSVESSPVMPRASRYQSQTTTQEAPRKSMTQLSRRDSRDDLPEPNSEYLKAVILKFIESKDNRVIFSHDRVNSWVF